MRRRPWCLALRVVEVTRVPLMDRLGHRLAKVVLAVFLHLLQDLRGESAAAISGLRLDPASPLSAFTMV